MTMTDICQKKVYSDPWHPGRECGRSFKNEEQQEAGLCGIHLAAKKRREEKGREQKEDRERESRMRSLCMEIEMLSDLSVSLHFSRGKYTDNVCVNGNELLEFIREVR